MITPGDDKTVVVRWPENATWALSTAALRPAAPAPSHPPAKRPDPRPRPYALAGDPPGRE